MDMRVKIAGVEWNNPVTVASGTFGSGEEYSEFVDLNRLGAVTTKGVANVPWPGNPTPRVAEIHSGMMNAIGLQNPGIDVFCKRDIPFLRQYDTKIIVNVCGRSTEDYCEVVERLANEDVDMLEINISCPNVKEGGIAFGQDAVICCDIVVKVLYDRCHMVCFQSSHIKLSFPVRVGDLNDFYIHSEKVCHIWNDCHPESFRNETCDYDVLVYFIRNLGLHLYFLKQIVNNTSQTGGLRKINLGIRSQFLQIY